DPATDAWVATSLAGRASDRSNHAAVWTGTEMIVWGGNADSTLNTGGRYDPATDTWAATSLAGAPNMRLLHTAVWTGTEMIVWGGLDGPFSHIALDTGGRYNAATGTRAAARMARAACARAYDTAV